MTIAESMKDTTRDIMASYNQRVKAIGDIVDDTHSTLKGFTSDHRKMSAEQAKALAEFTSELSSTVEALMGKISDDHAAMSNEQKAELAKGETERHKTFKGMMSDIQKGNKDSKNYVASMIGEYRTDMNKAHAAWSSMAATLAHARKKGIVPSIEMGGEASSVEEAVEKKRKKKEKEEAGGEG